MTGRRWRRDALPHSGLALICAGLVAGNASAACPPDASDGAAMAKGDLLLAFRPVLNTDPGSKAMRIPMAQHFALEVQLCEKGAISAAQLQQADATMPAHRHGMNYRPAIKPLGGGRFRVEGMMFHMAGHWQLAFEVKAGEQLIRLTHDLQVD